MEYPLESLTSELSVMFKEEGILSEDNDIIGYSLLEAIASQRVNSKPYPSSEDKKAYVLGYFAGFVIGFESDEALKRYFVKHPEKYSASRSNKLKGMALHLTKTEQDPQAVEGLVRGGNDITQTMEEIRKSAEECAEEIWGEIEILRERYHREPYYNNPDIIKKFFNERFEKKYLPEIKTLTRARLMEVVKHDKPKELEALDNIKTPFDALMTLYSIKVAVRYRDQRIDEISQD
tara:strand:- start:1098 stop:1799 length:702 start_codon:yes stop_codon:yes gene_type:complete